MNDKDFELESIIAEAIAKKNNGEKQLIEAETDFEPDNEAFDVADIPEEEDEESAYRSLQKPVSQPVSKSTEKANKKSQKKKKKKMNKALKITIIVLIVILSIFIVLGVTFVIVAYHYINKIDIVPHQEEYSILDSIPDDDDLTDEPDSPLEEIDKIDSVIDENINNDDIEIAFDEDVYNVLLIGTDSRNNTERGRSDSMILISINKETEKITMTSFMRDSYVSIPGKYNNRINAAYAYGGAELLMDTIEANFKVEVDKYVRVNFFSFMEVIDAVGGVTITVTDAEVEVMNDYISELNSLLGKDRNDGKLEKGGTYNLTGKQALGYCRIRYVGNADFQRTQRQRDVLMKVLEKAKGMSISELDEFLNVLLPKLTTNIQDDEIFKLLLSAPKMLGYDVQQLRVPADGTYSFMTINSMSVLGIDFNANIEMLQKEIYG